MIFDLSESENLSRSRTAYYKKVYRTIRTNRVVQLINEARTIALVSIAISVIGIYLFGVLLPLYAATKTWDGGGADNNWSTCANWNLDTCPATGDTVVFDGTSSKNVTIDASAVASIAVMNINAGYGGTITLARTFTISTFSQATGSFTAASQALSIGAYSLSGGSFTASTATTTITGNFTITNTPTFNANGGTVNFAGSSLATYNCNSAITFNLVTFSRTSSTNINVNNCTLPVGNNPTLNTNASGVPTLSLSNTTISGTGTLTLSTNAILSMSSSANLSGFSGLSVYGITLTGVTQDFSSFTTFALNGGDINLTSGANLSLPNTGNYSTAAFTLNASTFKSTSGILSVTNNFTVSGVSSFNANSGTINFTGPSSVTVNCNNITFNNVTVNRTGSSALSLTNCNFPLGNNPTFASNSSSVVTVTLNTSTLSGTGTLSFTTNAVLSIGSGSGISGFSGLSVAGLTLNNVTQDYSSFSPFTMGGDINLSSGANLTLPNTGNISINTFTLNASTFKTTSGTLSVSGAFTVSGASSFDANGGTINFTGASNVTASCNNVTFANVTVTRNGSNAFTLTNCSFPLGNNPTFASNTSSSVTVTLNTSTLSGTGTLSFTTNAVLSMGSGSGITGFSGLSVAGLTLTNVTQDYSSFSPFTLGGDINLSSGANLALPNSTVSISTFALNSSTFTAPSATMNVTGNFTISGASTFNANSGTINFTGSSTLSMSCNNATFSNVTFTRTGSSAVTLTNCSLPLGNNPTVATNASGAVSFTLNSSSLSGSGTLALTSAPTLTLNSGSSLVGFTGLTGYGLTVNGPTVDFSSFSPFTLSGAVSVSSGSLALPANVSVTSFTLSGGTFTAPSGNLTVSNDFTISNAPTFNANGGTIVFTSASTATISCNNYTFNLVSFTASGIKTVQSNCSLPLGNNPTISGTINNNGTLSGSGTLAMSSGTLTLNSGSSLSGFSGYNFSSNLTIAGATANFTSASSFSITGTTALSSGSLALPSGTVLSTYNQTGGTMTAVTGNLTVGAFILNGASVVFNAPSGNLNVNGNITISTVSSFNANGGTINLTNPGTVSHSCNNVTFNKVTFNNSGLVTVGSNCSFPLGADPTIASSVTVAGTLSGSGTLTNTAGTLTLNNGSTVSGFSAFALSSFTLNGTGNYSSYSSFTASGNVIVNASSTLTLPNGANIAGGLTVSGTSAVLATTTGDITVGGTLTIATGTVNAPTGNLYLGGNFVHTSGTYTHNNGTIVFNGTNQTISGATTIFYNFTKIVPSASAQTLTFPAGVATGISGALVFNGYDTASRLLLRSSNTGTRFNINASGSRNLLYLDVRDSNNTNVTPMEVGGTGSIDSTNNIAWNFGSLTPNDPSSFGPSNVISNVYALTLQPTFTFTISDPNPLDTLQYQLQVSTVSDYSTTVIDYTSAYISQGSKSFTVGQHPGSGTYTTGSFGQTLTTNSYYWRVKVTDNNGLISNYTLANTGSIAFLIDSDAPDAFSPTLNVTSPTTNQTPQVSFSTTDNVAVDHYQVKVDSGGFFTRTSPYTLPTLSNGSHTITVRAYDTTGNTTDGTVNITVDTSVPNAFTPTLNVTSPTTNQTPDLSFSTTDNDGIDYYQVKIDGGSFTTQTSPYTLPTLSEGSHTITVRAFDIAGNYTDGSVGLIVDLTSPNAFTPTLNVVSPTSNTTPQVSFSTTDANGINHYEVKIDAGSFSTQVSPYTTPILGNGDHTIVVRAYDNAGNYTDGSVDVTIDVSGPVSFTPTLNVTSPTNNQTPELSFSTTAPSGIDHYEVKIDAGLFTTQTSPYTLPTLSEGSHTITVRAIDNNTNYTDGSVNVTVDITSPAAFTPSFTAGSITNDNTPRLTFHTTDTSGIDYYQVDIDSSGFVTQGSPYDLPTQADGSHSVVVRAYDNAGNYTDSSTASIVIDTELPAAFTPTLNVTSPTDDPNPIVTFSTTDNVAISNYQVKVDSGLFSVQVSPYQLPTLANGSHTITVRATDTAGNHRDGTVNVTVDITAPDAFTPTLNVTSPTNNQTPELSFSTTDDIGIDHYEVKIDSGSFVTQTSPYTLPTLASGNHTITVRAFNLVNNYTDGSVNVTIDITNPQISANTPRLVYNSDITNTTITVSDVNGVLAANVNGTGGVLNCTQSGLNVSCTVVISSSGTLHINATDNAGNLQSQDVATYVIETTAPVITINAPTKNSSSTISDTTINVTDNYGIDKDDVVAISGGTISCVQTNFTTVDCTATIPSSGDLTINATDLATNADSQTETGYVVSTSPPNAFTPTLNVTSPTTNTTPILFFSTTDTDGIDHYEVKINSGSFVTQTSPYQLPDLGEGAHTITVRAFDTLGNYTDGSVNVTIDNTPPNAFTPTLNVTSPTNNTTPQVSFSTTDATGINHYEVKVDSGSFSTRSSPYTLPALSAGLHTITVRAFDNVGLFTDGTVNVTIDGNAPNAFTPTLNVTSPTNNQNPELSFSTTDNDGINHYEVKIDSGSFVTQTSPYTLPTQSEGNHTYTVRAFDNAGNYTEGSVNLVVDITAPNAFTPTLNVTSPTNNQTPEVSFSTTDNIAISYYQIDIDTNGFSTQVSPYTTPSLADGLHTITVRAFDTAGNYYESSINITVSLSGPADFTPTLNVTSPTNNQTPDLSFSTTSNVAMDYYQVQVDSGSFVTQTSPYTLPTLSEGLHTITVRAFDISANSKDGSVTVTVDVTAPNTFTPNITSPTNDTTPDLTFSTTDTSGINHYEVQVDSGSFTTQTSPYTLPVLTQGSHSITVVAFDNAGNTRNQTVNVVIDTTTPVIVINAPTLTSNAAITNTTLQITDNNQINTSGIAVTGGSVNCTQTNVTTVDCSVTIPTSGTLNVTATDSAGNQSTDSQNGYLIDSTGPVIAISAPTKFSNSTIIDTTIQVTDNNAINVADVIATGGVILCSQINASTIDCTVSISASGNLQVTATDLFANTAVKTESNYIISNGLSIPLPFTPTLNTGSYTSNKSPVVSFFTNDDDGMNRYEVKVDSGSFSVQTSPYQLPELSEGFHTILVRAYSNNGNFRDGSVNVTVDTINPSDITISLNVDSPTNNTRPFVYFSANDSSGIDHFEVKVASCCGVFVKASSPYQVPELDEESHTITVRAFDKAGNTSESSVDLLVDLTAPTGVLVINNGESITYSKRINIQFNAEDNSSGVSQMILSENPDFTDASYEPYAESKEFVVSNDYGNKTIYVMFKDRAGNQSIIYTDSIEYINIVSGPVTEIPVTDIQQNDLLQSISMSVKTFSENLPVPLVAVTVVAVAANIVAYPNIVSYGLFLIRFRKKKKAWGVVYNKNTLEPVSFATVRLYSADKKFIAERITDFNGTYGFVVDKGKYTMEIKQADYLPLTQDFEYKNDEGLIATDLALTPVQKTSQKLNIDFKNKLITINKVFVYVGFILSVLAIIFNQTILNIVVIVLYILQFVIYKITTKQKREWGYVYNSITNHRVKGAFVRIYDANVNRQVQVVITDEHGRYAFDNLKEGDYLVSVYAEGYTFPSNKKHTPNLSRSVTGMQFIKVKITKGEKVVLVIPIDPVNQD